MTQEHREQFLAAEGWQQTERGHVRVERFERVPDDPFIPHGVHYVVTSIQSYPSRKFRRFPFGRQPKYDALVGWFDLGDTLKDRGELKELVKYADQPTTLWDDGWMNMQIIPDSNVRERLYLRQRNKRQGWDKYGEVMG